MRNGKTFLIDTVDVPLLAGRTWFVVQRSRSGMRRRRQEYVMAWERQKDGKRRPLKLHCLIMGEPGIDHINHDGLDNRRANLRKASQAENARNRRPWKGKRFKGVGKFVTARGLVRYRAQIMVNRTSIFLGCFDTEIEAARAYNNAAREYFGEFAYLNEVSE